MSNGGETKGISPANPRMRAGLGPSHKCPMLRSSFGFLGGGLGGVRFFSITAEELKHGLLTSNKALWVCVWRSPLRRGGVTCPESLSEEQEKDPPEARVRVKVQHLWGGWAHCKTYKYIHVQLLNKNKSFEDILIWELFRFWGHGIYLFIFTLWAAKLLLLNIADSICRNKGKEKTKHSGSETADYDSWKNKYS